MPEKLPKWIDDWEEEPAGLSTVFNKPCDITESVPVKLDENYYGIFLMEGSSLKYVKIHELTLRDVINFKKANPGHKFVMSYDEANRRVAVM